MRLEGYPHHLKHRLGGLGARSSSLRQYRAVCRMLCRMSRRRWRWRWRGASNTFATSDPAPFRVATHAHSLSGNLDIPPPRGPLHQRRIRIQDPKLVVYHQRIHCTTYMMCLDSIIIHRVIQILIATLSSYGEFVRDRTGQGTVSLLGHQS